MRWVTSGVVGIEWKGWGNENGSGSEKKERKRNFFECTFMYNSAS